MPQINLLNTNTQSSSGRSSQSIFKWIMRSGIVLLALILLYGVYVWFSVRQTAKEIQEVQGAIVQLQEQMSKNSARNEVVTRQGQLKAAGEVIANHGYWSVLIPELARITLKSVSYADFSVLPDGGFSVTVNVPSYSDLDKYLQAFDLPDFNKNLYQVRIVSVRKVEGEGSLQYQVKLQMRYNQEFVKKSPTGADR